MKETRFIAQNKEKWVESEKLLSFSRKDPEKLSNLFTQVVDDLSYSRTYYPNRSVRVYLNKVAREYFSIIYASRREKKNRFKMFWLEELPQVVIHCRKELIVALLFFILSMAIGVFSAMKDPQFTSSILGESYVEMTKGNIEKNDPMAVYKQRNEIDMFLSITFNNLMVAFRVYVFGIFLSLGTLAMLMYNGIMVGCFQYFFIERGLFAESALTIWLHGTLEISSIVLAGGAGLTLGRGLVFPGTYSRLQAFQISGIRSLKLMLGVTPIFVIAAIIESFLTRYTETPDAIRLLLILLSAGFIVGYFVVYPWYKVRSGFEKKLDEVRLPPSVSPPTDYSTIKNNAEILKEAFLLYKDKLMKSIPWILGISTMLTLSHMFFETVPTSFKMIGEWWQYAFGGFFTAMSTPELIFIPINAIASTVILYYVLTMIDSDQRKETKTKILWLPFLNIFLVMCLTYAMIYVSAGWASLVLVFLFIPILLIIYVMVAERTSFPTAVSRGWALCAAAFSQTITLGFVLLLVAFSFLMILSAPLLYMYTTILQWNFAKTDEWVSTAIKFLELLIRITSFNLVLPVMAAGAGYLYYTLREISSAQHLMSAINNIGKSQKSRR